MTDQKPNRLFGSNPLTTVAIVIYFRVGYVLTINFWPDSNIIGNLKWDNLQTRKRSF